MRAARQQDFLRQAKQQVSAREADRQARPADRRSSAATPAPTPGLRSRSEVLRLLKLARVLGRPADPARSTSRARSARATWRPPTSRSRSSMQRVPRRRGHARAARHVERKVKRARSAEAPASAAVGGPRGRHRLGKDQALQAVQPGAGRDAAGALPDAAPAGLASTPGPPRVYKLRGTDGKRYGAYRMVLQTGPAGEYYGVQGTTWKDPPILDGAVRDAQDRRAHVRARTTTATACGWWPGTRPRPSTGSRTRCSRR